MSSVRIGQVLWREYTPSSMHVIVIADLNTDASTRPPTGVDRGGVVRVILGGPSRIATPPICMCEDVCEWTLRAERPIVIVLAADSNVFVDRNAPWNTQNDRYVRVFECGDVIAALFGQHVLRLNLTTAREGEHPLTGGGSAETVGADSGVRFPAPSHAIRC